MQCLDHPAPAPIPEASNGSALDNKLGYFRVEM